MQRNQISCDCPRVPKRSKCGIPELKCGISDRSETGTNTGLEAYIHFQAQPFIFFGVVNGVIRLVFISYIKNIPLISLGHCCVYLPSTDNLILFYSQTNSLFGACVKSLHSSRQEFYCFQHFHVARTLN